MMAEQQAGSDDDRHVRFSIIPLHMRRYHHINDCSVATMSIVINSLLMYIVMTERNGQLKIYSRVLMQNCVIDTLFTISAIATETQMEFAEGYLIFTMNSFVKKLPMGYHYFGIFVYCILTALAIHVVPVMFYFRYMLLCKTKVMSNLKLYAFTFTLMLPGVIELCLCTYSMILCEPIREKLCPKLLDHPIYWEREVEPPLWFRQLALNSGGLIPTSTMEPSGEDGNGKNAFTSSAAFFTNSTAGGIVLSHRASNSTDENFAWAHPIKRATTLCMLTKFDNPYMWTFILMALVMDTVIYSIMIFCTIRIFQVMKSSRNNFSVKTMRLQRQMNYLLFCQMLLPLFTSIIPVGCMMLFMVFEVDVPGLGLVLIIMFSWMPLISPATTIFFVHSFRRKLIAMLLFPISGGRKKQNAVTTSMSNNITM